MNSPANHHPPVSMTPDAAGQPAPQAVDPEAIIKKIQLGRWRGPIDAIRQLHAKTFSDTGDPKAAKKAVDPLKKKLPGIMFAGTFKQRGNAHLETYSALLCADLDHLDPAAIEAASARARTDPHVAAAFRSPTDTGLKIVFYVAGTAAQHDSDSFNAVRRHVASTYGHAVDESCKNLERLCFVSYDPLAFWKNAGVPLPPLVEPAEPRPANGSPALQLETRKRIAVELLGPVEWSADTKGFCPCPGQHLHTSGNGPRDCELHLDGAPTLHCFHDSCAAIRDGVNHELRSRIGKAEHSAHQCGTGDTDNIHHGQSAWRPLTPLPDLLPAVQPFNFDCLPGTLRPWLEDISDRMQCPPDFPAVGAVIALASLIGRKVGIRPKRQDDWLVIPNLWGMVVGRPGLMKTPALEQALAPLNRLAADALAKYETETEAHMVSAVLDEQRKKLADKAIHGLLKKGDEQGAHALAKSTLEGSEAKPVLRRYKVNDPTVEKLGELLNQNPNGLLLYRDEVFGFLRTLDKEGREDSRAFFLEAWNGSGDFTCDRIGRGTVRVEAVTVSILGAIQPGPLSDYLRQAVRNGVGDDGLLQRFQLAVWPDMAEEWRNVDRWPNTKAKNDAFGVFQYLDSLNAADVGADSTDGIPFLRFTPESQARFDQWREELEAALRSDRDHPAFEAHLAKYRKLVPALALILHLANRNTGPVALASLEMALLWANYLESHARRIYSAVLRPDMAAARELAKHLKAGKLTGLFTLRETYRKGWTGLATKEDAEAATEILSDLGWIRPVHGSPPATGRPSGPAFEVHPQIGKPSPVETDRTAKTPSTEVLAVLAPPPAGEMEGTMVSQDAGELVNADLL